MSCLSFWILLHKCHFPYPSGLPPPETFSEPPTSGAKVEWFRCPIHCYPYTCLLAFFHPFVWSCLLLCLFSYSVRMFAITAFITGIFHRAFKTSRVVQFIGGFIAFAQLEDHSGGQHIIGITGTLTRIKTCIPPKQTAYFGVILSSL